MTKLEKLLKSVEPNTYKIIINGEEFEFQAHYINGDECWYVHRIIKGKSIGYLMLESKEFSNLLNAKSHKDIHKIGLGLLN